MADVQIPARVAKDETYAKIRHLTRTVANMSMPVAAVSPACDISKRRAR